MLWSGVGFRGGVDGRNSRGRRDLLGEGCEDVAQVVRGLGALARGQAGAGPPGTWVGR